MAKKGAKRKVRASKKIKKMFIKESQTISEPEFKDKGKEQDKAKRTQALLLDNFIALQEALTSIGYDLKELNKKISSLLELFENAAKSFEQEPVESKTLSGKLDTIIEQNKTIAKTLLLMSKTRSDEEEGFKRSIKSSEESEEDTEEEKQKKEEDTNNYDESNEETDTIETDDEEFKPEPLPEFNF